MATQARVPVTQQNTYVAIAFIAAVVVFAGFARTFFLNSVFARRDLGGLRVVHGIVFASWFALVIAQTTLVARNRVRLHQRLGYAGMFLALAMIVVGLGLALNAAKYGFQTPGLPPAIIFVTVPFFDIVVFTLLVGAAFLYRNRPETHKRLMVLATLSILPPAIARIPLDFILKTVPLSAFGIGSVIVIACIAYDYAQHRRLHPAYLWGGLLIILSFPLRLIVAGTPAWQAFARWMIG